jgi:hypothetical protein
MSNPSVQPFAEPAAELALEFHAAPAKKTFLPLEEDLASFNLFGQQTRQIQSSAPIATGADRQAPVFVNEFWTARQRQAHSLHEISYRACFKPQLPRFFIERLTQSGDTVYDPFMGRGTTLLEAALLGRIPSGNDINPLSRIMAGPRLNPPVLSAITRRILSLPLDDPADHPEDLLVFYHPETLRAVASLRKYFRDRRVSGDFDADDGWLEMVSLNRLTGHSSGFFSVYTLPPNQAVSLKSQRKINERRGQSPPHRDVRAILLRKSRQLLADCDARTRQILRHTSHNARLLTCPAASTPDIPNSSVALVVTSPPFLDVVDYATDNWLRCWFAGIDAASVELTVPRKIDAWQQAMTAVFRELHRVLKPGGHVAFEVGEVHGGRTRLEETVIPCGLEAGLQLRLILINDQVFTKTANCWGVENNRKGTNTNRIVLFRKP